jgi:clan AA aspartic protease (TIGR02281 family)
VDVSGAEGWFLLDTGSSGSIVCPELAERLPRSQERNRISRFGGRPEPLEVGRAKSESIRFAGSRLKYPEEVDVLDLGFLADWAGTGVDGILGWDILREYVWGIDVPGGRLIAGRERSPSTVLLSLEVPRADATLPLEPVEGRPTVTAYVGSNALRLVLDTGAERTIVSADAFKRLGLELSPNAKPITRRGVNGDASGYVVRLDALRLGPLIWTEPEVIVRETADSRTEDGLLGMDLLSDYVMVFDGPSRTLYVASRTEGSTTKD